MSDETASLLEMRHGDHVVVLALNRPDKRNALATPLLEQRVD